MFLRPDVADDRSLWSRSAGGRFGADGTYVLVVDRGRTYAAAVPLRETFTCTSMRRACCVPIMNCVSIRQAWSGCTTSWNNSADGELDFAPFRVTAHQVGVVRSSSK